MKSITIPESEYLRLVQTIQELRAELEALKTHILPVEKKQVSIQPKPSSPISRLKGVITLPTGFNHKDFLGDELLAAYLSK
jgi:hypothetical protein